MKSHHWLIVIGVFLILQFIIIAPTLTPEDLVTTVPLMVVFGIGGYSFIFAISAVLMVIGVVLLLCVSKRTLSKLKLKLR
jgi:hypothetical protein